MTDDDRADQLAAIVMNRRGIRKADDIDCPFAKTFMTPCIVRDGSMCLGHALSRGPVCIGCDEQLSTVEAKAKGPVPS